MNINRLLLAFGLIRVAGHTRHLRRPVAVTVCSSFTFPGTRYHRLDSGEIEMLTIPICVITSVAAALVAGSESGGRGEAVNGTAACAGLLPHDAVRAISTYRSAGPTQQTDAAMLASDVLNLSTLSTVTRSHGADTVVLQ